VVSSAITARRAMKRELYAEVSTRIVAELEAGAAPWVKPWSATRGANTPCNAVTKRPYYEQTSVAPVGMSQRCQSGPCSVGTFPRQFPITVGTQIRNAWKRLRQLLGNYIRFGLIRAHCEMMGLIFINSADYKAREFMINWNLAFK
jgi:hypothetical protein